MRDWSSEDREKLRRAYGLVGPTRLVQFCGISRTTLWRIESGRGEPQRRQVVKIRRGVRNAEASLGRNNQ